MNLRSPQKFLYLILLSLIVSSGLITGCANNSMSTNANTFEMAPLEQFPAFVQDSPVVVQEAYQFALANPDTLKQLPCYCGCGNMGHTSNYACYIKDTISDGEITFDNHALGCSICVDITQDAMRLLGEGKTIPELRSYVDKTYSQYGPSNIPTNE